MQTVRFFMLEGKDFFTIEEAAHYMCVSVSKFKEIKKENALKPINNHGKMIYRRADLRRLVEDQVERR